MSTWGTKPTKTKRAKGALGFSPVEATVRLEGEAAAAFTRLLAHRQPVAGRPVSEADLMRELVHDALGLLPGPDNRFWAGLNERRRPRAAEDPL